MNLESEVLEISSDEEGDWYDIDDASHDWLSEMLSGNDSEDEGSDDVVVLDGDSCVSTIQKQDCIAFNAIKGRSGNDSDDDCLVLDGDPDNPVSVVDESGNGSDDLLIVGEKGQLACRDYPHPRHLCAKFPFTNTPHEKYCDLCHCYVCDSLAPCMYWGTGGVVSDHCNSTDDEVWRTQRNYFKKSIAAPLPVDRLPDTAISMTVPLHNTQPTHSFSEPLRIESIPWKISVPNSIELVTRSSTSSGTIGTHRPNSRMRCIHTKSRYPQYPNGSQQLIPRTRTITRERGGVSASGPPFVPPQSKFKRAGSSGSAFMAVNQSGQGAYNSSRIYTALQPSQSMQATPVGDIHKWQDFLSGIDSEPGTFQNCSGPNSSSSITNFQSRSVSSRTQFQAYDLPLPQLEANQNMHQFQNPAPNATDPDLLEFDYNWPLNVAASQSTPVDPTFLSVHPLEPQAIIQPEGQNMQNTLGSLEFHEENWMHNILEHQPLIPETALDPMLSDLDFLPLPSSTMDPSMLFYGLESPWVI